MANIATKARQTFDLTNSGTDIIDVLENVSWLCLIHGKLDYLCLYLHCYW